MSAAKMKMKETVKKLAKKVEGKMVLGHVIWWSIERGFQKESNIFENAFSKYGLKESPKPLDDETAFTRAHARVAVMKELHGWLIRKIYLGKEKIVYGMVKETIEEKREDLKYRKEDKVTLNRSTKEVILENGLEEAKLFKKLYHSCLGRVDNWSVIDYLRKKMRELNTIQLREMGGVYFVPNTYSDTLLRLVDALQESSPESWIGLLPIYDDDVSSKSLKTAFADDFEKELSQMGKELDEKLGSDKTRQSTLKERLERFKDLRNRTKMYEDLLRFKADDLSKGITKLEKTVEKAMLESSEE